MKFRLIGTGAGKVCKVTGDRNSQKCLGADMEEAETILPLYNKN